ncbi:Lsr2 family protein [Streptomyces sp. NPDC059009]|uniref:histone-like nucleoid-structuring protein Lsr2 n=1 Tax=Streptomyces sp. NPDC059009 TaxID=3346694 RepID=UPI003686F1C5
MVQKMVTIYTDDLTGKESDEIHTHVFSLDGVTYEIDLTPDSYDRLYDALAPFIDNGRKQGRGRGRSARKSDPGAPSAEDMRAWAKGNGFEVNDRGRVPAAIREAYEKAH